MPVLSVDDNRAGKPTTIRVLRGTNISSSPYIIVEIEMECMNRGFTVADIS